MLDEEGVGGGFEDKVLHERLWWIIISLELSQNIDQNSSVKHWLTVNSGDEVLYLLEGEASELLHDLDSALHLLTLECQQGLLRVVKLLKASPGCSIVKQLIVLVNKCLAYLLILRVQSHPDVPEDASENLLENSLLQYTQTERRKIQQYSIQITIKLLKLIFSFSYRDEAVDHDETVLLNVWKVESPIAGKTRLYTQTESGVCREKGLSGDLFENFQI